jgi:hypothetical protein
VRSNSLAIDLIGHPGSGGGGGDGGGNRPNCTMHTARNQKLVNGGTKKPYHVALLQNEDGTVSASASGKTKSVDLAEPRQLSRHSRQRRGAEAQAGQVQREAHPLRADRRPQAEDGGCQAPLGNRQLGTRN